MDDDLGGLMDSLNDIIDFDSEQEASELDEISTDISDTYLWVLAVLGIPGNLFTIISILTMAKTSSATFFVALLAIYDVLALTGKVIGHPLYTRQITGGDVGCKLQFIPIFLSTMANWALVLIALERFFSVCYPLQKAYLFTKKRSYLIAGINSVVLFVVYGVVYCTFYKANKAETKCGVDMEYNDFFGIWYWIHSTLFLFLPSILSTTFTTFIIRSLYMGRKVRRNMLAKQGSQSGQGGASSDNNKRLLSQTERAERMITIMLVLAVVLFVLLSLPACIFYLSYDDEEKDALVEAKWKLFKQCSFVLLDSTHAINFFLYFISAKRFRNHFISMVTCKRFPKKAEHSGSSNASASNCTERSNLSTAM